MPDSTEESNDEGAGKRRSVFDRLDTVAKRIAAIAGVVVAIAGAFTAVRELLPKDTDPVNLEANLDPIKLRVGVALDEFAAHETFITASANESGGVALAAPVVRAGTLLFAQVADDETAQSTGAGGDSPASSAGAGGETSSDPGGATTTPGGETTTGEDPPVEEGETTGEGETGEGETGTEAATDEPVVPPLQEARCAQETTEPGEEPPTSAEPLEPPSDPACGGLIRPADRRRSPPELRRQRQEVIAEIEKRYVLGEACDDRPTSPECPLTSGVSSTPLMHTPGAPPGAGDPADEAEPGPTAGAQERTTVEHRPARRTPAGRKARESEQLALARAALRQLRNTRSERGPDGRKRPLGVIVDYGARLCGFGGKPVEVFWSMFETGRERRLPYLWVGHRRAHVIKQRSSNCEEFAPRFWVPLPAVDGTFVLELSVRDDGGTTRFRGHTKPFKP